MGFFFFFFSFISRISREDKFGEEQLLVRGKFPTNVGFSGVEKYRYNSSLSSYVCSL